MSIVEYGSPRGIYERGRDPVGVVRVRPWPFEADCARCGEPRMQRLVARRRHNGETWEVQPCAACAQKATGKQ